MYTPKSQSIQSSLSASFNHRENIIFVQATLQIHGARLVDIHRSQSTLGALLEWRGGGECGECIQKMLWKGRTEMPNRNGRMSRFKHLSSSFDHRTRSSQSPQSSRCLPMVDRLHFRYHYPDPTVGVHMGSPSHPLASRLRPHP